MSTGHIFQFDSIGSRFWIERLDGKPVSRALQAKITQYAERFDNDYSRFKNTSLVAQLAKKGVLADPPAELINMLRHSKEAYQASEGAFNITVGPALHAMGYGEPQHGGVSLANPWEHITWDTHQVTVPKGLMLDFGGFGKGWMIDVMANMLHGAGYPEFIVNGGGDLYVQSAVPVSFTLEDPHRPGKALGSVDITKGALAGSDTVKRAWQRHNNRKHHIVDPVTNDSSNTGITGIYVVASTALIADTMATALILRPDLLLALQQRYGISAHVIC